MPITPREQALQETEQLLAQDALRPQASHSRRPVTLDDLLAEQAAGTYGDPVAKAKGYLVSLPVQPDHANPDYQHSEVAAQHAQTSLRPENRAMAYGKPAAEGTLAGLSFVPGPVGAIAGAGQVAMQAPELVGEHASNTSRLLAALSLIPAARLGKEALLGEKAAVKIGTGRGVAQAAEAYGPKTKFQVPPSEGGYMKDYSVLADKPKAPAADWAAGESRVVPPQQHLSREDILNPTSLNMMDKMGAEAKMLAQPAPGGGQWRAATGRNGKPVWTNAPAEADTVLADMQQRLSGSSGRGQTPAVMEKLTSSHTPGWQDVSLDTVPEPRPSTGLVPADIESRTRPDYLTQDVVPNARLNPSWSHGGPGSVNPIRPEESITGLLRELGLDSPANMRSLQAGQPIYPEGTLPAAKAVRQRMKISGPR